MKCPTDDAWMSAALGDVTVNTRTAMLEHERTCERCRSAHQHQLRMLSDLKAPPALHESEDAFVASVMARCARADDSQPEAREPARVLRFAPWVASALAVAAMLALAATRPFEHTDRMQARGGSGERSGAAAVASADVFLARGATLSPLAGAQLHGGDRLAVRVTNKSTQRRFFMAFAIDAKGEVHWVYPAYLDARTNPESPELTPAQNAEVLPETVELVDVADGSLRVVAVVSERRLTVKDVEQRLASSPNEPLVRVFSDLVLREWRCTWRGR